MPQRCSRRWLTLAAVCLVSVVVQVLVPAAPASAHASGELPRAQLRADGDRVIVDFIAPADDAAAIGTEVGLLGDGAMVALLGGPSDDLPTEQEVATLSSSPELRSYLERHIRVSQAGRPCPGQAEPGDDFLAEGAVVEFRCPGSVEQADIAITVLHDVDPAYRVFSVDGTTQYAIHSAAAPEHTWDFTTAGRDRRLDPVLVGGAVVGILLLILTVGAVGRRSPRDRAGS